MSLFGQTYADWEDIGDYLVEAIVFLNQALHIEKLYD